jgi:hypothetical protein
LAFPFFDLWGRGPAAEIEGYEHARIAEFVGEGADSPLPGKDYLEHNLAGWCDAGGSREKVWRK